MFVESVVTEKIYNSLKNYCEEDSGINLELIWVAKNSEELKSKGIDPNFLNEDELPPDDEYYYIRVWINCDLETILEKMWCLSLQDIIRFSSDLDALLNSLPSGTQQTNCKMPTKCSDCPITNSCNIGTINTQGCHAKLFRHFANL